MGKAKEEKKKNWLHTPENLTSGHIAYLVKFLGSTEVDQPKGIEVVKEGIRKLKFAQQIKKAEGTKTPKGELTVSVDGVAIQESKSKKILHQYPLHRISYCADDKAEKRFFSFIAKEANIYPSLPAAPRTNDPFGMTSFAGGSTAPKDPFSSAATFGNTADFSLDELDPLRK